MKTGCQTISRKCLKIRYFLCSDFLPLCLQQDRFCQRMLTFLFQSKCHLKQLLFAYAFRRNDIGYFRLSACDRTGLIECYDLHFSGLFQRNSCFKHDSMLCTHTISDHDRNRGRKSEGTRAADNQNGNGSCQCISKGLACQHPYDEGDHCDRNDCRYKHTGNLICDLGDRCLCGCRITDHLNDL